MHQYLLGYKMTYYYHPRFLWLTKDSARLNILMHVLHVCSTVFILLTCVFIYHNPYLILVGIPFFFAGTGWLILDSSLGLSIPFRNLWIFDRARRASRLLFSGTVLLMMLAILLIPGEIEYRSWTVLLLIITLVALLVDGLIERIEEERVMRQGFTSTDGFWKINVKNESVERIYSLSIGDKIAPIQPDEVRLAYRITRKASSSDLRMLERIVRRICFRRVGFKRGQWTILPTGMPRIFIMYKGDLESRHFIADREVSWIIENPLNDPERILEHAQNVEGRKSLLRKETLNHKNVFYAGNFAVINLGDIVVQVDLHDSKVYRANTRDDWGEERERFVCIVPIVEKVVGVGRVLMSKDRLEPTLSEMNWQDAVILSKILNIAQETSPAFDLVSHTRTFK
ncbi:MAG: hypothetical protein JSW01_04930 [Candidatus Bathyarchaeota archaeon]|nr:MAG: hypothetical protein JSW01_04930 [Candidatus Bathyarchaeota archaeon]